MKLYRYINDFDFDDGLRISLMSYSVYRETEMCFVIKYRGRDKFILKNQSGKRFAYATRELALNSIAIRTQRRVEILESKMIDAKRYREFYTKNEDILISIKPLF